jgi:Cu+-exporting ATPase
LELLPLDLSKAVPGQGIEARIKGARVLVGKRAFLEANDICIDQETVRQAEQLEQSGRTVVWVARDAELLGTLTLMDVPRQESSRTVGRLKTLGIDVTMVTGDNAGTAGAVATGIGIEAVIAGMQPAGKAERIEKLRSDGRVVAMAGDGINDAPALAAADVGIALASGTDIAMESADVVLVRNDLEGIVLAIELSRKTFVVIKQNLFWAFFYNVAAIPLAMAGLLSPIVAAGAMAISSVTVVMNSLRLR